MAEAPSQAPTEDAAVARIDPATQALYKLIPSILTTRENIAQRQAASVAVVDPIPDHVEMLELKEDPVQGLLFTAKGAQKRKDAPLVIWLHVRRLPQAFNLTYMLTALHSRAEDIERGVLYSASLLRWPSSRQA